MSVLDPTPVPAALTDVGTRVEAHLAAFLAHEATRWSAIESGLTAPIESLARFVASGGKRLRPAFSHWAWVGAGGDPDDLRIVRTGAALELLHAFALVHDDVMDGSATRRGRPTVHIDYTAMHAAGHWQGEDRRFGEGVAILIGDLACVYADAFMNDADPTAITIWNELRVELLIGQYLDVTGSAKGDVDLEGAHRIAEYKSGKYTIERPLHLGAALAGRFDDLEPVLTAYGSPLGVAFQLRDDVLGIFGDSEITGKPVGDDLREGKPTPLLATARQHASTAQRERLSRVGAPDLSEDEVVELQQIVIDTGARAAVERSIDELTATAIHALDGVVLAGGADVALRELAAYIGARQL